MVTVHLAIVEGTTDLLSDCQRANAFDMPLVSKSSMFFKKNLSSVQIRRAYACGSDQPK